MTVLILAVVLFGLAHLVSVMPAWRDAARLRFGTAYGPVYGLTLLILFGSCIAAYRAANYDGDYTVLAWGRHANHLLSWLAFLCLGIFLFRGSWRNRLRFPMAIATLLWGCGHLLANVESRAFVLFGGLMVIAVVYAVLMSSQPVTSPAVERSGHNLMSLVFGTALYGIMTQLHSVLIGVPVFTLPL